jgi:hypothetical protein
MNRDERKDVWSCGKVAYQSVIVTVRWNVHFEARKVLAEASALAQKEIAVGLLMWWRSLGF